MKVEMTEMEKKMADALANVFINRDHEEGEYTWEDWEKYKNELSVQINPQAVVTATGYNEWESFVLIVEDECFFGRYVVGVGREHRKKDYARERALFREGFKIFNFTEQEVLENANSCAAFVYNMIEDDKSEVDDNIYLGKLYGYIHSLNLECKNSKYKNGDLTIGHILNVYGAVSQLTHRQLSCLIKMCPPSWVTRDRLLELLIKVLDDHDAMRGVDRFIAVAYK